MDKINFDILDELGDRFKGKETTSITLDEYKELNQILSQLMISNKELTKVPIDVLCYRLGIKFDRFILTREKRWRFNTKGDMVVVYPLLLTLKNEGKTIFIMEGGCSGEVLNDLIALADEMLILNLVLVEKLPPEAYLFQEIEYLAED